MTFLKSLEIWKWREQVCANHKKDNHEAITLPFIWKILGAIEKISSENWLWRLIMGIPIDTKSWKNTYLQVCNALVIKLRGHQI